MIAAAFRFITACSCTEKMRRRWWRARSPPLVGKIDNQAMAGMNARVQLDRLGEARVAAEFVRDRLGVETPIPGDNRLQRMLRDLGYRTLEHLALVLVSLSAAVLIGVPLGILAYRLPKLGAMVLGVVGVVQTIPSLALMIALVPILGLGFVPAVFALTLYSLLPIVRNTFSGLKEIPEALRESAEVLGLSDRARLRLVELPIASRSILSGIKTAAVINVGVATIGGLIGAGGYGQPIMTGIRLNDPVLLLLGAVPAALMAVLVQWGFDQAERWLIPAGLRAAKGS
jgi:osmoprotectant transport system permease protein